MGFASSGLPGPAGNLETFVWLAEGGRAGRRRGRRGRGGGGGRMSRARDRAHPPPRARDRPSAVREPARRRPPRRRDAALQRRRGREARADRRRGRRGPRGLGRDVDLCIVLGGDGTILTALRHYAGTGVPVFAVNYGEVGFLATIDPDGLGGDFDRAFAGEFETLGLPTITVGRPEGAVDGDQRHLRAPQAGPARRRPRLRAGGRGDRPRPLRRAGGRHPAGLHGLQPRQRRPVLAWGVHGYVVSFIAPHSLTARALVVRARRPADDQQRLAARSRSRSTSTAARPASCRRGRTSTSSSAARSAMLAQLPGASFYHRLRERFGRLAR